jgi:hypothetical protein
MHLLVVQLLELRVAVVREALRVLMELREQVAKAVVAVVMVLLLMLVRVLLVVNLAVVVVVAVHH